MARSALLRSVNAPPKPRDVLELLKPITWFPPVWAYGCGVVSGGVLAGSGGVEVVAGVVLVGPLVCGTSQAVNDWFDRHVDAINEPGRPIPSGRIAGRWGLAVAMAGTALSLLVAAAMGPWILAATLVALVAAWAYSAPPLRLKASWLWGPATVALSYEGLTWFTGAVLVRGALPPGPVLAVIALYSAGAFGIMTLNDFKAVAGDRATGVRSLPVVVGVAQAARIACVAMAVPQIGVVAVLVREGHGLAAALVAAGLGGQAVLMARLLRDPVRLTPWFNATGTSLYVLGMLVAAGGLGGVPGL